MRLYEHSQITHMKTSRHSRFDRIVFDVDGTLIDSADAVVGALLRVTREFMSTQADNSRCRDTLAMHTDSALRFLGIPEALLPEAVERYDELYTAEFRTALFPGVADMLTQISAQNIQMAILSARRSYELYNDAVFSQLKHFFHIVMDADFATPKPSPDGLIRYTRLCGVQPNHILYIGDTMTDSICAHSASIPFALSGWNTDTNFMKIPHQYLLKKPADLLELLDIDEDTK